jgi:F0F1-type ATP synthase membrane subunit c/vacuolar-type H+-ATPase subunit K
MTIGSGVPSGILASGAVPGAAAEREHFTNVLITRINGAQVEPTMQSYCNAVGAVRSGDDAVMSVIEEPGAAARLVKVKFQ